MVDWNKYIGIPWKFNGDDFGGCDCVGLLRLVARDNNWTDKITDNKPIEKDWHKQDAYRMIRYFASRFKKIEKKEDLIEGDIVYFKINGEGHIGIWVGYGKYIEQYPPLSDNIPSSSHLQRFEKIKNNFVCGFRRGDENARNDTRVYNQAEGRQENKTEME